MCGWLFDAVHDEARKNTGIVVAKRASDAMLKMVKCDIATLEEAYAVTAV
jgi:hypothetical protein